jgi:hypothetical protein
MAREITKVKENPGFRFRMTFKAKTDASMSLPLLKKHWKDGVYFQRFLHGQLKGHEPLPAQLECDAKLVKTRINDFFACIPTTRPELKQVPWAYEGSCIALDPGVRTFLTGYDPSGRIDLFQTSTAPTFFGTALLENRTIPLSRVSLILCLKITLPSLDSRATGRPSTS